MQLYPPICLNEIGRRTNNEDSVFPPKGEATAQSRLFLVCDGVGGAAKGEVASALACQTLAARLGTASSRLAEDDLHAAISATFQALEDFVDENPASSGMACTLTLLHLSPQGATIAHLGDSRVYHLRNGQVRSVTRDHSLVMDMVEAGILSPEQAADHPKKNVINKALVSNGGRHEAKVTHVTDILPGDVFFLCTDGVLESIDSHALATLLTGPGGTDAARIEQLHRLCLEGSYDNFSCYFVRVI